MTTPSRPYRTSLLCALLAVATSCSSSGTEPVDPTVPASITLSQASVQVYPDRTSLLPTATVYNGSHQVIPTPVTWQVADTSVARIYGTAGYVLGNKIGVTAVIATAGPISQSAPLTVVREPVVQVVVLPLSSNLYGRDSVQLSAYAAGAALDSLPGRLILWGTHNGGIITVSPSGLVHGIASGTAYVIASSEGVSDSAGIAVDVRLVAKITVAQNPLTLVPGAHSDIWITHLYDATNTELFGRTQTWTSSDNTIATVTWAGVNALKTGTVTLTVRADTAHTDVPLTVAPVTFTAISTGASGHVCALTTTQEAYCWGTNYLGELGTTPYATQGNDTPSPVLGGLHFTTINAGQGWTCALAVGGTPYCWGGQDQVGNGSWTPKIVAGVTLVALSNTGSHACGLDASGIAWCWRANQANLIFTPPTGCGSDCLWTPVATGNGKHWSMISGGSGSHVCGIDTSNTTQCWGVNNAGQLGDSTITSSSVPVAVHGGLTFTEVSAGGSTSCGLTAAGDAYCWGSDLYGVIGSGVALATCESPLNFFDPCALIPRAVAGGHKFAHISTDDDHACGLTSAGAVWCWGYSENGDGTPTVPSIVAGSITFTSITIGGRNCGMATDGMAYCWSGFSAPLRVPGQQ